MRPHELALKTGRALQSQQTGWIQWCFESERQGPHHTIPLLENSCFALALFRSRMSDAVLEGIGLVKQLLAFEVEGHFPTYLHEYPKVRDSLMGLRLAAPLYWIGRDFGHILGGLKEELKAALMRIAAVGQNGPLPKWADSRVKLLQGKEIEPFSAPPWPADIDEVLITLQMAGQAPLFLAEQWDPFLGVFCGPIGKRFQEEGEPALHFRDLFFGAWAGKLPARAQRSCPHPIHLKGALVRPMSDPFPKSSAQRVQFDPQAELPLVIYWGDEHITHSFVLARKHLHVSGSPTELILTLPEEIPEEGERRFEVSFFLNLHADHDIFIEGKKATTFQLGETILIESKGERFSLCFHSTEGHFFGHLLRGNRPSQLANKGDYRFEAFDWQIALRSCSRPAHCSIRVTFEQVTLVEEALIG